MKSGCVFMSYMYYTFYHIVLHYNIITLYYSILHYITRIAGYYITYTHHIIHLHLSLSLSVCMHIYIYMYIYIYLSTCIYIYRHTYIYIYAYIYIYIHIHTYTRICMHTHTCSYYTFSIDIMQDNEKRWLRPSRLYPFSPSVVTMTGEPSTASPRNAGL